MKVKCIHNTGAILMGHSPIPTGIREDTIYDFLEIGKEYYVMGQFLGETTIEYLIDDAGIISTFPYQLFEVVNHTIPRNWYFNHFLKSDIEYPYRKAIWGYKELCMDNNHFEDLIEKNEEALDIYFEYKNAIS